MAKKKYLKFIKGQHSDYKVTNGLKKDKKKKFLAKSQTIPPSSSVFFSE